jgi:hypothetical protein
MDEHPQMNEHSHTNFNEKKVGQNGNVPTEEDRHMAKSNERSTSAQMRSSPPASLPTSLSMLFARTEVGLPPVSSKATLTVPVSSVADVGDKKPNIVENPHATSFEGPVHATSTLQITEVVAIPIEAFLEVILPGRGLETEKVVVPSNTAFSIGTFSALLMSERAHELLERKSSSNDLTQEKSPEVLTVLVQATSQATVLVQATDSIGSIRPHSKIKTDVDNKGTHFIVKKDHVGHTEAVPLNSVPVAKDPAVVLQEEGTKRTIAETAERIKEYQKRNQAALANIVKVVHIREKSC